MLTEKEQGVADTLLDAVREDSASTTILQIVTAYKELMNAAATRVESEIRSKTEGNA